MPYHGNGYHVPPEHANRTAYYEGRGGCAGKNGKMWNKNATPVRGGTHRRQRHRMVGGKTRRRYRPTYRCRRPRGQ